MRGGDKDRRNRVQRLRDAWRKRPGTPDEPRPSEADEADKRRDDALASNDRIRAEAPEDLENRRRADQLEREIRRTDHPDDR